MNMREGTISLRASVLAEKKMKEIVSELIYDLGVLPFAIC